MISGSRVAQAFSNPKEFLNTQEQFQVGFEVLVSNFTLVFLQFELNIGAACKGIFRVLMFILV